MPTLCVVDDPLHSRLTSPRSGFYMIPGTGRASGYGRFAARGKDPLAAQEPQGFALIVALTLMGFILLLLLSLSTLLAVEIATTRQNQALIAARENARLGLMVALGELQRTAGQDQRVTARAEILGDSVTGGNRYWTGVWDNSNAPSGGSPSLLGWYVSGYNFNNQSGVSPQSFTPQISDGVVTSDSQVLMVGANGSAHESEYLVVPLVEITNTNNGTQSGAYAYWISDEGVKASVGLIKELPERPDWWLSSLTEHEKIRMGYNVPERTGYEFPLGELSDGSLFNPDHDDNKFRLSRLLHPRDLINFDEIGLDETSRLFHAFTGNSLGVLSRTDGNPGLKHDLSRDPSPLGTGFVDYINYQDYMVTPSSTEPIVRSSSDLRRHHRIVPPTSLSPAQDEVLHSVAPVLTDFGIQFAYRVSGSLYPRVILAMKVGVEMWNPYSTAIEPEELILEISGLNPIEVTPIDNVTGVEGARISTNPHDYYGDPIILRLNFEDKDNSASMTANSYDANAWGPGRVVYWVVGSTVNLSPGQRPPPEGITLGFGSNNASKSYYIDTGMRFNDTFINTASRMDLSYNMEATSLRVVLKRASDGAVLAEYNDLEFWDVVDSARFLSTGWSVNHIGFQFRKRERGGTVDSDPSIWLKTVDPRTPINRLDLSDWLDDYSANYVWRETVITPELPTSYHNTIELSSVNAPEYIFYRNPIIQSVPSGAPFSREASYWRDLPLFELPRQPLLSLGSLQHLQIGGMPPYSIGNSWGDSLNSVFDTYYLSGLQNTITGAGLDTNDLSIHPRLMYHNPDASVYGELTLDDIQAMGGDTSVFYLSRGMFNINSTSVDAWEAVLASNAVTGLVFVDRDLNQLDSNNITELNIVDSYGVGNSYDMPPMFMRFPQSFQELFQRPIAIFKNPAQNAPYQFFQRGFKVMAERVGQQNNPSDYDLAQGSYIRPLAEAIVERIQARGMPFSSMREFLSPQGTGDLSLLEDAILSVPEILQCKIRSGATLQTVQIEERLPAYLSQADILNAIAPIISNRSDTFLIRSYGEVRNSLTGRLEAKTWCEAVVQRVVAPVDPGVTITTANLVNPPGDSGRKFIIVDFRWLSETDL